MKQCLFFNPIIGAKDCSNESLGSKIIKVGNNTGNLVYVETTKRELKFDKELWLESEFERNNDVIGILPCANMIGIHDGSCTESWASMLEKNNISTVIIGLGAQTTAELNTPKKLVNALGKDKISAVRKLCSYSNSVGIRGNFTAECLDLMGIHNYRVIGCPSVYMWKMYPYKELCRPEKKKVIFNVAYKGNGPGKIMECGMKNNGIIIMQAMDEMPKTIFENATIDDELVRRKYNKVSFTGAELEAFLHTNAQMFFSYDEWEQYLRTGNFTFSFGNRFHGNVLSMINGIPAVWITHDGRTEELVETFELPHVSQEQYLKNDMDIDDLIGICDYSKFYKRIEEKYTDYLAFLKENNLELKEELECLPKEY